MVAQRGQHTDDVARLQPGQMPGAARYATWLQVRLVLRIADWAGQALCERAHSGREEGARRLAMGRRCSAFNPARPACSLAGGYRQQPRVGVSASQHHAQTASRPRQDPQGDAILLRSFGAWFTSCRRFDNNSLAAFDLAAAACTLDPDRALHRPGDHGGRVWIREFSSMGRDFALRPQPVKRTEITERVNFEFRAQFLNAFNRSPLTILTATGCRSVLGWVSYSFRPDPDRLPRLHRLGHERSRWTE